VEGCVAPWFLLHGVNGKFGDMNNPSCRSAEKSAKLLHGEQTDYQRLMRIQFPLFSANLHLLIFFDENPKILQRLQLSHTI
jgi:hypothetical protein